LFFPIYVYQAAPENDHEEITKSDGASLRAIENAGTLKTGRRNLRREMMVTVAVSFFFRIPCVNFGRSGSSCLTARKSLAH